MITLLGITFILLGIFLLSYSVRNFNIKKMSFENNGAGSLNFAIPMIVLGFYVL
jgi:hypothetical protein